MTESRFKGLRTFIVDLVVILSATGVALGIVWANYRLTHQTDPDMLWTLAAIYGGVAGKGAWGKLQAGKQEIEKIKARS